jgi:hypothetical protein
MEVCDMLLEGETRALYLNDISPLLPLLVNPVLEHAL